MSKTSRQAIALSAKTTIDFKVDPKTGVGYMSRRELARQLGVSHTAINKQVSTLQPNAGAALDDFLVSKVSTYFLTKGVVRNVEFVEALMQAGARAFIYSQAHYNPLHPNADLAVHTDLMFKINIPERWVVEVIQRSQSSVRRSLSTAIKRSIGSALEKHYLWRDGERWYSAWFLANAPFAKEDGMVFKNTLTKLAETLGLESEIKQFLLPA